MTSASNHPTAVPEAARPPVTDVIGGLLSLLSLPSMPHLAGGVGLASRELGGKRKHKGGKLLCVRPRLYGVVPILIVLWDGLPGSCPSRRPPVMAVSPPDRHHRRSRDSRLPRPAATASAESRQTDSLDVDVPTLGTGSRRSPRLVASVRFFVA